jgi:hypothetical protein
MYNIAIFYLQYCNINIFQVPARKMGEERVCAGWGGGERGQAREDRWPLLQAIAKPSFSAICHSEGREESRIFNGLRSFTTFRMTRKTGFAIACNIQGSSAP